MTPITSTIVYTPPPPTFVATYIPGNSGAVRAPADAVAPSVSNAEIHNDTKGSTPLPGNTQNAPVQLPVSGGAFVPSISNSSTSLSASAQMTFMAQMIGQDSSPVTRHIMVEYEKMMTLSQVKYKPSNAGLPQQNDPADVFQKMLAQEKTVLANQLRHGEPVRAAQVASEGTVMTAAAKTTRHSDAPGTRAVKSTARADARKAFAVAPHALHAYAAVARRNAELDAPQKRSTDPIEAI